MKKLNHYFLFSAIFFLLSFQLSAQVKLPRLIGNNMVLQRDVELKIWGWASPNEKVTVSFQNETYTTETDNKGTWSVQLPPMKAGGPYEMKVNGKNKIEIKNILVGDVWLCSGQSNMAMRMSQLKERYAKEIADSGNDKIRTFNVPQKHDFNTKHQDVASGEWLIAKPKNVLQFSAAAYFFAKDVYENQQVPIGLLHSSLGGSRAQAWICEEALKPFPEIHEEALLFQNPAHEKKVQNEKEQRLKNWENTLNEGDEGYKSTPWYMPDLDDSDWKEMPKPAFWSNTIGNTNGVVWLRKEIEVTDDFLGKEAVLKLGRIHDHDSTFVNGKFVGTTKMLYIPRVYKVPAGVLKKGKNVIAVRVLNHRGRGGFIANLKYELVAGNKKIDLKGKWKFRLGKKIKALPWPENIQWKPTGLYNAMISPLLNYKIKGAIWYQGEGNVNQAEQYNALLSTLITDWRAKWKQGDFPFLIVQLPNYMKVEKQPKASKWAMLREAQLKTLSLKNTGLAVTIDIGEWNDIHPRNKKDVGKRLAIVAEKVAYGKKIVHSGPMYKSVKFKKGKAILSFDTFGSKLSVKNGEELQEFAIAGKDKKFVWAKAIIKKGKIIVWSDKVEKPEAVRYAWGNNPDKANLANKEGLMASPFRTDDWRE